MLKYAKKTNLDGYTVIFPSCGVGNVAQLTVDLLIATLRMERSATGWHRAIVPLIGPAAYAHTADAKTTACELYTAADHKLAVFQMRTPLVAALMADFFAQLIDHLVEQKVARLIVLTSSHAYEKHSVSTTPFEFRANVKMGEIIGLDRTHWSPFVGDFIFGGGYANALLAATAHRLAAVIMFKYVSEGDNTPDATQLLAQLNGWLSFLPQPPANAGPNAPKVRLVIPSSWKFLYGNTPPDHIY